MYFWVTFFSKVPCFHHIQFGHTSKKSISVSLSPTRCCWHSICLLVLPIFGIFLTLKQQGSSFRGFFSSPFQWLNLSVVLCLSGSLFLSLSVWIVNHGEREFSPSVPSNVALAPCWDNMANAQNSLSSAKRTGMHMHILEMCRYITIMYIHTVCTHFTHTQQPYVHRLCICSTQSKQSCFCYWVNIQRIELSLLLCWCWKKWARHWMWLLAYRLMSVTPVKVTSLWVLVHKELKVCISRAAWIKKIWRIDCIHIDGIH